jgi:CheY-like chemotaxis protein
MAALSAATTVLVVEDDQFVRKFLVAGLEHHGFRVLDAAGAEEAVRAYTAHRGEIDVVLLDVKMPGVDGPTTLVALQAIDPFVPVIFMTGESGDHSVQSLMERGAVAVLLKPFRVADVAQTLRGLAQRGRVAGT